MGKIDDHIRSFAMSGYMITDDLKRIEDRFKVELGHVPKSLSDTPADYYPQFEQSVRGGASGMSRHYELFYCLENAIRKLITETLLESVGTNWWDSGKIPEEIVRNVITRNEKEVDNGVSQRSDSAIDYTTFGELSVIITKNWELFGTVFSSRRAVDRVMKSLNLLRGPIAHCCPLSEDEIVRLRLTVKDWFRMIG